MRWREGGTRGKERRQRAKITYLASWFIIDVLGCLRRGSHGYLGQVLCLELDLQVVSIGQAVKERGEGCSPLYSTIQECCKEATSPYSCLQRHVWGHLTQTRSPCLDAQILFFPDPDSFCPLDSALFNPPWGPLLLHLAQRRPLSLLQLEYSLYRDLWCYSVLFKSG